MNQSQSTTGVTCRFHRNSKKKMKIILIVLCFLVVSGTGYKSKEKLLSNKIKQLEKRLKECTKRLQAAQNVSNTLIKELTTFDIRVDTLPEECKNNALPKDCAEATACTERSGIYRILPANYSSESFLVECDVKTEGGNWTILQRRQDGSVDFYRKWDEYQKGFGEIKGEFFIGLDKLHALTNTDKPQELLVLLKDKKVTRKAFYSNFVVGPENDSYDLKSVGNYSGDAGDSLSRDLGAKFSTKDHSSDSFDMNCARLSAGAWWYKQCYRGSNLNAMYGSTIYGTGVNWQTFLGYHESIQQVVMMIRPRSK